MRRTTGGGAKLGLCASLLVLTAIVLIAGAVNAANPGANGKIAFQGPNSTSGGAGTVYTVNPDGSGLTDVTQNDFDTNEWYHDFGTWTTAWSPDGSRITFDAHAPRVDPPVNPAAAQCPDGEQSIWTVEPDGSDVQALLCANSPSVYITPSQMSWSPDGSMLVVDSQRDSGTDSRIHLIDPATGNVSLLAEYEYATCGSSSNSYVAAPAWSPSGDRIAFTRIAYGCDAGNDISGIWTMDVDGSNQTQVTTGFDWNPDWSPDGDAMTFVRRSDDGFNPDFAPGAIYSVTAAGGTPTLLTDVGSNVRPSWSPDGQKIAFASDRDPDSIPDMDIFVMDADGTDVQQVTDLPFLERDPSWQPLPASDPDADGDGVDDVIDVGDGAFDDGDGTTGSIVDRAGLDVLVTDATDVADGVQVTVGAGSGRARLSVCGFTIQVPAGSEVIVTCGSVTLEVVSGTAKIALSDDVIVTVPQGGAARATDNGDGTYEVENVGTTDITVTVDGQPSTVGPGGSTTVSTDTTDPTITGAAAPPPDGQNGWNLGNVTVTFTCADGGSGIESCTAPATLTSEGAGQSVTGTAVDEAGNSASATVSGIDIDKSNPTVTCVPAAFILNQPSARVSANVSDAVSGAASPNVSAPVSTAAPGTFATSLTGTDIAGRTTTVSCGFAVRYAFQGFFQPIDNPPVENREEAGRKIPVKWRITDYNGVGISNRSSFVSVTSTTVACSPSAPHDQIESNGTGPDLRYLGNGNWQYNWKTLRSFRRTCVTMQLNLADKAGGLIASFRFR